MQLLGCEICDFDTCSECASKPRAPAVNATTNRGHPPKNTPNAGSFKPGTNQNPVASALAFSAAALSSVGSWIPKAHEIGFSLPSPIAVLKHGAQGLASIMQVAPLFSVDGLLPEPYEGPYGRVGELCKGLGGAHGARFWRRAGMMPT